MQDREELWQTGKDEPVQVNQRALIDNVLARYSGEFTLFRELLQNSDDAQSTVVEIRFETAAYIDRRDQRKENLDVPILPDLKTIRVAQWTFRNNGEAFTEKDWKRLPKIASGNPSPEKIGAFGVGFYSLFSVTDCPLVTSGEHWMRFFWEDNTDQLCFRRGDFLSGVIPEPWTTFEIRLREAGPIPPALEFMQFLASSIMFMVNLMEIKVFVDEHRIGCIKRFPGTVQAVGIPEGLKCSSPLGIMNMEDIQLHPITVEAEVMHAVYATGAVKSPSQGVAESCDRGDFFSCSQPLPCQEPRPLPRRPEDPTLLHTTTVDLTVFTTEVKVKPDEKLATELLRSTKKQLPSQLKYGLIYTGKDEYDRSLTDQKDQPGICDPIFQGLRADLDGAMHTRIFIGHATGQTTGIGGHMASYFIPTVERESIDLVNGNIAVWNKELLYVGGFLARAVYELELSKIQDAWEGVPGFNGSPDFQPPAELQEILHQRFLHILKFFSFYRSTPSEKVAQFLETAFYGCSTAPPRLLSSTGVHSARDIKECDPSFAKFLKFLPMLPQCVIQERPRIIKALRDRRMISRITFLDILQDLQKHVLNQEELLACLQWWTSTKDSLTRDPAQLLSVITLGSANGTTLSLSSVEYFIGAECNKARIPLDGPLPPSLMFPDITAKFTPADLMSFGWQEFTIIDWLRHISQPEIMSVDPKHDFTRSVDWAQRVLGVLSGVWSLHPDILGRAKSIFSGRNCIPTSHHLRSPEESFLSNTYTTLFRDLNLPIVRLTPELEIKGDMEGFLSSIGVRKHVPPQLVLDRMTEAGNWCISDLISYLVQIQNILNPGEFTKLKSFEAFTEEGAPGDLGERRRYCASNLYPPLDMFRKLKLPVIDLGEKSRWRNESDQAELLYRLGLCRHPPLERIVELSTAADATVRETAFKYLCDNLRSKYSQYNPDKFRHIAFIPAEKEDGACLEKLGDVFLGPRWKALGFSVVQDSYRKTLVNELGVQQHPPTSMLLQLLETTPPTTEGKARQWFECLFECISNFSPRELTRLSGLPIVPTRSSCGWKQLAPNQCYLGEGQKDEFHTKLFVFVDFSPTANRFLRACGSKDEPSVKDIAESLAEDPQRFHDLAGGHDGFLTELRDLASRRRRIPNATLTKMTSKPILLGIRRKKTTDGKEWEHERALRKPGEIVIVDDMNSYQLFGDTIFVAPQEAGLEGFYASLGCHRLSTVVQEQYKESNVMPDAKISTEVQSLILERLPPFLHEDARPKSRVPPSWSLSAENFKVKVCETLRVSRTITIGNVNKTQEEFVWAAARCDDEWQIELWVLGGGEPDMYEIATSLCRLLFGTAKVNDTLLLTTILSTPPDVLKRRGYNVDKFHKPHQQEPEEPMKEVNDSRRIPLVATTISEKNHLSERSVTVTADPSTVVASPESSKNPIVLGGSVVPAGSTPSPTLSPQSVNHASNNARNPIQNLKSRFVPHVRRLETTRSAPPSQHSWTPRQVIPQSYIRANVNKAMKASNPKGGMKLLHHRNKVEKIREFPNRGYCDASGQVEKLKRRGKIGHVEVFIAEDVPDADAFRTNMHDMLHRFVNVLTLVAKSHEISPALLHVFYEDAGGPIAFNDGGRIYLNLRYFEAWHDQDVQKGDLQQAQTSWFFVLAHELAHNLIEQHNSEHEFWFSAICEAHISALSQISRPG